MKTAGVLLIHNVRSNVIMSLRLGPLGCCMITCMIVVCVIAVLTPKFLENTSRTLGIIKKSLVLSI